MTNIPNKLTEFLTTNINLIDTFQIEELYKLAPTYDRGKLSDVLIEIGIDPFQHLTSMIDHMFCGSSIDNIVIPDNITVIETAAFYKCTSLTSVTIGSNVTIIGESAFSDCYNLTSIEIPNSVTSIGDHAFSYCSSLTSITIPDSVTSIGRYAFVSCTSLTSVTIPDSVTFIGDKTFYNCPKLTEINFNKTVLQVKNEQWHIEKKWRKESNISKIVCIDGEIEL